MKKFKKILIITLTVLLALYISGSVVAVQIIYGTLFHRVEAPDFSGFLCYSDIAADYPRQEICFPSGEVRLTGWLYGEGNDDGLVVMAHGLGSTAESYLHITRWFVDRGYRVLTYDATGTGASGGKDTRGMSQSVLDLDAALDWVEGNDALRDLPLLLFGHSWGATPPPGSWPTATTSPPPSASPPTIPPWASCARPPATFAARWPMRATPSSICSSGSALAAPPTAPLPKPSTDPTCRSS